MSAIVGYARILNAEKRAERLAFIKHTIDSGGVCKFTNTTNGQVKLLSNHAEDDMGDMEAYFSTGMTPYLCWEADKYDVSAMTKEEARAFEKAHT